jgi:hypothetical protein
MKIPFLLLLNEHPSTSIIEIRTYYYTVLANFIAQRWQNGIGKPIQKDIKKHNFC